MDKLTTFYNERAEASVLAGLLTDEDLAREIHTLSEGDFNDPENRDIFNALQQLAAQKRNCTDLVELSAALKQMYGEREAALLQRAIGHTTEQVAARYSFEKHVSILKAAAKRRALYMIFDRAKKDLRGNADTDTVLEKARQELREINTESGEWESMTEVLAKTFHALEKRSRGEEPTMPSGVAELDTFTTGFRKGEMTIIGARPSVGKSAFAANIALQSARAGYRIAICSREMTDVQYGQRIIQRGSDIESVKLKTGNLDAEDWRKIAQALSLYANCNITFAFKTRHIEDLRAQVQNRVDSDGLDMLIVDYAQLMLSKGKFEKDFQRIGFITKTLKDISTDLNISVIALAQVGRETEKAMPSLADLRGSGDMEQDADNVIFLHRPESAADKSINPKDRSEFDAIRESGRQMIIAKVAKQRQGKLGKCAMIFDPERMTYYGIER